MLAGQLASARLATAKYATDLDRAKADGDSIITRMVPETSISRDRRVPHGGSGRSGADQS